LIDRALQRPAHLHAGGNDVDNIHVRPTGTSAARALRALREHDSDLHKRVLRGELSPHAAAVKAGLRTRTISVPFDVERAANAIVRHFGADIKRDEAEQRKALAREMWLNCYLDQEIAEAIAMARTTVNRTTKDLTNRANWPDSSNLADFSETGPDGRPSFAPPIDDIWFWPKSSDDTEHFGKTNRQIVDRLLWLAHRTTRCREQKIASFPRKAAGGFSRKRRRIRRGRLVAAGR
jgi:hypothetical protein